MRNLRLTLTEKGLLLVIVPMVLLLILLACLAGLLGQTAMEAKQLDRIKEIEADANAVNKLSIDCGEALAIYALHQTEETEYRYNCSASEITQHLSHLMEAVRGKEKQQEALERVIVLANECLEKLDEAKHNIDHSNIFDRLNSLVPSELLPLSRRLGIEVDRFVTLINKSEHVDPAELQQLNFAIMVAFTCSFIIIAISVVVALVLYKRITSRLSVLLENNHRLAMGTSLIPLLGGSDEIGTLDRTFHEMATALNEAAKKERAMFDNARDVICSLDASGRFLRINPACETLFGLETDALIGCLYDEVILEEDQQKARDWYNQTRAGASENSLECRIKRPDGQSTYVLWSAHWSEPEESWFCVIHNITDQKELERLRQQFAAMIGHELRTPLTAIRGNLDLMSGGIYGALSERGMESITFMRAGLNRLLNLINELLDLEKMSEGKLTMLCDDMIVADAVKESYENVYGFAEQQLVSIELDVDENAVVWADHERIVQVLVNLISNAVKYSPPKSCVRVSSEALEDSVKLLVSDAGTGIPAEYLNRIFDRFVQVDAAKDQRKGSGLGLTISKSIVEQHGGTIGVCNNQAGAGAIFWFTIPRYARQPLGESRDMLAAGQIARN